MTVPPALTWTCLFPADASYRCDAAPDWMLQMLRFFEEGGGRVQVGYGQCARSDSKDLIGQIVINTCLGVERELRDGDFTYIRRFAVLPSLRNARSCNSAHVCALDCHVRSRTAFRECARVRTKSRVRWYFPVSGWRTIGPSP